MSDQYYPESLLRDYKTLMQFFPTDKVCRPALVESIKEWKTKNNITTPRILEIGPGYGETTEFILNAIPCEMVLVEVDKVAADGLSRLFADKVEVITANAMEWIKTQPSESFDIFTASWTLHNFPEAERNAFLPEVYRVLKKGGLFTIFDKIFPDDRKLADKYNNIQFERLKGLDAIGETMMKEEMLDHEARDIKAPYRWEENGAIKNLEDIGFKDTKITARDEREVVLTAVK